MAKIDETKLEAIISQQIELAKSHDSHEREGSRSKALDYYLGKMDGYVPAEANRSKVVSRDVADTIGWMLPGIMRVFTASDQMAVADPVGEEDVDFAGDATDGMNYTFWKENKGYEIVYKATWDSLLTGNGIVKTYYDDTPIYSTSFHTDLSEDQVAMLLLPDDDGETPEVLAQSMEMELVTDEASGQSFEMAKFDLKIKRKKADGRIIVEAIAPEKFLIDQDAVSTDDAAFTAHWERKTRSELVSMGYDKDEVWSIPEAGTNQTPEEAARNPLMASSSTDKSMELVDYYECYVQIDADDDGVAELVRACHGGSTGGKLLDWEIWEDENPFDDIPCEPIPHRWSARSIADETMDVQDIKTVLLRQGLNATYWANNPQRFATGKIKNPDELQNPTFGGVVFGEPGAAIVPLQVPVIAETAFAAIAYQDEVIQRRTGIGRGTMALDPEALQNQTATANQNAKDAGYSQVELVARNMAEWGWKKVFRKLMRLMIKHQDNPRVLMINGKPKEIDPRYWNADMDVTINVGLGTGSRDRDMAMLQVVQANQKALVDYAGMSGNPELALDMLPKVLNGMRKMAEAAGIKDVDLFYPEITPEQLEALKQQMQAKAGQPSPEMQLEQAKLQISRETEQMKAQANVQKEAAQMEADLSTEQQKQQFERERADREMQLEFMKLNQARELKLLELGLKSRENGEVVSGEDVRNEAFTSTLERLTQMVEHMARSSSAPKRRDIIRDHTGRAIGAVEVPMTEQ